MRRSGLLYGLDCLNRLASFESRGASPKTGARYAYRADGMRVAKETGLLPMDLLDPLLSPTATRYRHDGQMRMEDVEVSSSATAVTRYGLGQGEQGPGRQGAALRDGLRRRRAGRLRDPQGRDGRFYAYGAGVSNGRPVSVTDGLSGVAQTIAYASSGGGLGQPYSVTETDGADSYSVSYAYGPAGDRAT